MIQEAQTVMLAPDWLEEASDVTAPPMTQCVTVGGTGAALTIGGNWEMGNGLYTYPTSWYSLPTKVRLKMSEVEKLRAAAKKDKALREVLEKFGPHIEVEVDFG